MKKIKIKVWYVCDTNGDNHGPYFKYGDAHKSCMNFELGSSVVSDIVEAIPV